MKVKGFELMEKTISTIAWGDRELWDGGFLDNAGLVIFKENGELVDFLGYC